MRPPGLWSDSWTCARHGDVAPVHCPIVASDDAMRQLAARTQVPMWLPWPLPAGWLVTGLRWAGDEHSGPVATVMACSGPNHLPSGYQDEPSADLLLVAEQPGVGLGAHLAGLTDVDPGATVADGAADVKLGVAGHDTPLWLVPVDGLAAYVGEAAGVWLWALAWPETASAVLMEPFELADARDPAHRLEVPYGALSPRLG